MLCCPRFYAPVCISQLTRKQGQRCPKKDCPCRIHNICVEGLFKAQKAKRCPVCKTQWTGNDFVGERAVTTTEAYLRGRRRSGASRQPKSSGRVRRETVGADEDDEEEEEEEEGEME